jgi:HEPN domain-containing protein
MKNPKETSRRWLAQAEHSLGTTQVLLENGLWAGACFHSEQTAQLALKAFLYWRGRRFVNVQSIRALALECGKEDAQFLAFANYGIFLDRYHLATRYPDALPAPAIPFESFTQQETQQALGYATEIVELVRAQIPTE